MTESCYVNIEDITVTALFAHLHEQNIEEQWRFVLADDYRDTLKAKLDLLDFHSYNYINDYGVYWSGILTLEPFDDLYETHGCEESILNEIVRHHIRIVQQDGANLLTFENPSRSPLHSFFKTYQKSGFGGNVPYSLNALLAKIEAYIKEDFSKNMSDYGTWNILQTS